MRQQARKALLGFVQRGGVAAALQRREHIAAPERAAAFAVQPQVVKVAENAAGEVAVPQQQLARHAGLEIAGLVSARLPGRDAVVVVIELRQALERALQYALRQPRRGRNAQYVPRLAAGGQQAAEHGAVPRLAGQERGRAAAEKVPGPLVPALKQGAQRRPERLLPLPGCGDAHRLQSARVQYDRGHAGEGKDALQRLAQLQAVRQRAEQQLVQPGGKIFFSHWRPSSPHRTAPPVPAPAAAPTPSPRPKGRRAAAPPPCGCG